MVIGRAKLVRLLRSFADLYDSITIGLITLLLPLLIYIILHSPSIGIVDIIAILLMILVATVATFQIFPNKISRIAARFKLPLNYWQSLIVALTTLTVLNGIVLYLFIKTQITEIELLKLTVVYLSSILIIVPTTVKNLKEIFEETNTSAR